MTIRLECSHCGSALSLNDAWAGRRGRCPYCKAVVEVPALEMITPPGTQPDHSEESVVAIELEELDEQDRREVESTPPGMSGRPEKWSPPVPEAPIVAPRGIDRAYRRALLKALLPVRTFGEVLTFFMVLLALALLPYLAPLGGCCACIPWAIYLAVFAVLCSFFFGIVRATAEGDDHLPYLDSFLVAFENVWSEMIVPVTNFVITLLFVMQPAIYTDIILRFGVGQNLDPGSWGWVLIKIFTGVGIFLWPMAMLAVAFDNILLLFRPDVLARMIWKVKGAYVLCWLALLAAFGGVFVLQWVMVVYFDPQDFFSSKFLLFVGVNAVDLAAFIFAMRAIGLLYRHYEDRLVVYDHKQR